MYLLGSYVIGIENVECAWLRIEQDQSSNSPV